MTRTPTHAIDTAMGKKKAKETIPGKKIICSNRKAFHQYAISQKLEAGIMLLGSEVKSCRANQVQLSDAHIRIMQGEAFLIGAYISEYTFSNQFNHETDRTRKLLLHRKEIERLHARLQQKGETAVPLSLYFLKGKVKVEIGIGKGKAQHDKRQDIKKRDVNRDMQRAMRRG